MLRRKMSSCYFFRKLSSLLCCLALLSLVSFEGNHLGLKVEVKHYTQLTVFSVMSLGYPVPVCVVVVPHGCCFDNLVRPRSQAWCCCDVGSDLDGWIGTTGITFPIGLLGH